ncbi:hypothetical protein ACFV6B_12920 [Streptomyces microflavus]|uniref:hypothetical protein n=1 Tax=Streptomyces microflavus TaxID=1919 RepID=UPI003648CBA0
MNERSRITGQTAPTTDPDITEAHHRVVTTPTIRPRRLIAAGVKRGNGRLIVQAVAA